MDDFCYIKKSVILSETKNLIKDLRYVQDDIVIINESFQRSYI